MPLNPRLVFGLVSVSFGPVWILGPRPPALSAGGGCFGSLVDTLRRAALRGAQRSSAAAPVTEPPVFALKAPGPSGAPDRAERDSYIPLRAPPLGGVAPSTRSTSAAPAPPPQRRAGGAKRPRDGFEAASDVLRTAERLGLTGPLGGWPAHDTTSGGLGFVASLRESFRARATVATDMPRLRTALTWFEGFLEATQRVPFLPADGAENTRGQMWNAETLELFAEFVRRSPPRGRTKGSAVSGDAISGYVSAIRLFRSREARYPIAPPELNLNLPLALKTMRREDGPPGSRARSLGVRAETLARAAAACADLRRSTQGCVDWAAALIAHNALMRGGEVGVPDGKAADPARVIAWHSFSWQAPRPESFGRPWLILRVVPIKDPTGSKSAYPIPVPRRHDGPFGSDPMCPYDAAATAWWLRCAPASQPFPVDALGLPRLGWEQLASPHRPSTPFFTDSTGAVMDSSYVRALARRLARLGGMSDADVADVGGKAFRVGGATDWRLEGGDIGELVTKQRGRWDSDVAAIYQRPLLGPQLAVAAGVGGVRGAGLEELCAGFAQRAVCG